MQHDRPTPTGPPGPVGAGESAHPGPSYGAPAEPPCGCMMSSPCPSTQGPTRSRRGSAQLPAHRAQTSDALRLRRRSPCSRTVCVPVRRSGRSTRSSERSLSSRRQDLPIPRSSQPPPYRCDLPVGWKVPTLYLIAGRSRNSACNNSGSFGLRVNSEVATVIRSVASRPAALPKLEPQVVAQSR